MLAVASFAWSPAASADEVHVAFGDIATVESLNFLIALERAKERGVDVKVTFFKSEDVAAQVVLLASDRAAGHVTGQVVTVAGGMEGRVLHELH